MSATAGVVRPRDLGEALAAKSAHPGLTVLAGGTDLMVLVGLGVAAPAEVLDISGLDELRDIAVEGQVLVLGALTTYTELMHDEAVRSKTPLLAQASAEVGAVQIQNRGTIGGNVVNASPAGDTLPPLLAYGAELELASARGTRRVDFDHFYRGYKQMDMRPDEMLVRIRVRIPAAGGVQWFRKVGTRRAQSIAKVVAAATAARDGDGALSEVRIAVGSVAPTVIRLPATEALLEGRRPTAETVEQVRCAVRREVRPIDDVRSTAEYRRNASANVVARFVAGLVGDAPA